MAIDVVIKQKLFGRKTMPLEVILGEALHYGNFEQEQLNVGKLGETEFVAYNPEMIGRGFSVVWTPEEKKCIALRLPQPSTTQELKDFYGTIERIVRYWDGKLFVDDERVSLPDFMAGLGNMIGFNDRIIKQFSQDVLDGKHDTLALYSAMWPLRIGKEEAAVFVNDPNSFEQWLHEKQNMDVCYASPNFYAGEDGIFARFFLANDEPTIFPDRPSVPFGSIDPATGKELECKEWLICIGIEGDTKPLCEMEYDRFRSLLPASKISKYDAGHFLLAGLTEEEMRALATQ